MKIILECPKCQRDIIVMLQASTIIDYSKEADIDEPASDGFTNDVNSLDTETLYEYLESKYFTPDKLDRLEKLLNSPMQTDEESNKKEV